MPFGGGVEGAKVYLTVKWRRDRFRFVVSRAKNNFFFQKHTNFFFFYTKVKHT